MNFTEEKSNAIILEDFNVSVYEQILTSIHLRKYRFGNQNAKGVLLLNFCVQMEMVITETFYQVPNRTRYPWKTSKKNWVKNPSWLSYILRRHLTK